MLKKIDTLETNALQKYVANAGRGKCIREGMPLNCRYW